MASQQRGCSLGPQCKGGGGISTCCDKLSQTRWLKTAQVLQFWRSRVWNGCHGAQIKVSASLVPLGGSRENTCYLSASWALGPLLTASLTLTLLLPLVRTLVVTRGPLGPSGLIASSRAPSLCL